MKPWNKEAIYFTKASSSESALPSSRAQTHLQARVHPRMPVCVTPITTLYGHHFRDSLSLPPRRRPLSPSSSATFSFRPATRGRSSRTTSSRRRPKSSAGLNPDLPERVAARRPSQVCIPRSLRTTSSVRMASDLPILREMIVPVALLSQADMSTPKHLETLEQDWPHFLLSPCMNPKQFIFGAWCCFRMLRVVMFTILACVF